MNLSYILNFSKRAIVTLFLVNCDFHNENWLNAEITMLFRVSNFCLAQHLWNFLQKILITFVLCSSINLTDYTLDCLNFSNSIKLKLNKTIQQKKFCLLLKEKCSTQVLDKIIFDFSKQA